MTYIAFRKTLGRKNIWQKESLMTNGKLKVTDNPIIPFIEGDGVGRDIWKNAQAILIKR